MKNVVIIGASGTIGLEIAKQFLIKGNNVVAGFYSNSAPLNNIFKYAKKDNTLQILKIDLSNTNSIKEFFENTLKIVGKIDVLVNCAGVSFPNLLIDIDEEELTKELDINLKGSILTCKYACENMLKFNGGKIINIASIWGNVGGACESTYSASKAGLIGFSKALAKEMGPANITVNCISPGAVKSNMNRHLTKEDYQIVKEETPLGKIVTPKEIAKAVLYFASNAADNITGQNLTIDGGFIL